MVTTRVRWSRALVTGSSSGIGEEFARRLAAQGAALVVVARREHLLDQLAEELRARHSVDVEVLPADLTRAEEIAKVEERLADDAKPVDLLVNNAGGGTTRARFIDHDPNHVDDVALLNALAVHRLTHAAASAMVRRGRGHVLQVSAGVALYPVPGGATYAASKAFVNSFSQAVNRELAGTGVGVSTVCPGFTRTEAPARIGFDESTIPSLLWADPDEVVEAGLRAATKRRPLVFPTTLDRIGAVLLRHLPTALVLAIGARVALPDTPAPAAASASCKGTAP